MDKNKEHKIKDKDCLFCRIIAGQVPSVKVGEAKDWVAIEDINPKAPVHVLVMPRKHIKSVNEVESVEIGGKLILAIKDLADKLGIKKAYQVRIHTGEDAGQTVDHLHLHLLGGWKHKQTELNN